MEFGVGRRRRLWLLGALGVGAAVAVSLAAVGGASSPGHGSSVTSTRTSAATDRRILFVGASYTWGLGARPHTDGYAWLTGRDLQWPIEVDGIPGTGFLNPGPHHQGTFDQRLEHLPPSVDPALVVIQGGRNDAGYPGPALAAAVTRTIDTTRTRFDHARIALLGPIPATLPVNRAVLRVEATMAAVARHEHVTFIDPIAERWITPGNVGEYAGPVAGHPNNAGYAMIATRLSSHLKTLLPADRPGSDTAVTVTTAATHIALAAASGYGTSAGRGADAVARGGLATTTAEGHDYVSSGPASSLVRPFGAGHMWSLSGGL